MTNNDIIKLFFTNPRECSYNNLRIEKREDSWILVNYYTDLVKYDTLTNQYTYNSTKYSRTTSKIQNTIRHYLPMSMTVVIEKQEMGCRL